ncbi:hypothetical protein [Bradyrhizobium cenepequi]
MALNVILCCLVGVSALNFILVLDAHNRSKRLVELYEEARRVVNKIHLHVFADK